MYAPCQPATCLSGRRHRASRGQVEMKLHVQEPGFRIGIKSTRNIGGSSYGKNDCRNMPECSQIQYDQYQNAHPTNISQMLPWSGTSCCRRAHARNTSVRSCYHLFSSRPFGLPLCWAEEYLKFNIVLELWIRASGN